MSKLKLIAVIAVAVLVAVLVPAVHADSVSFATASGATTSGGAVNASATITTGAGTVSITLTNLQANPGNVAQLISDLSFTLSGGTTGSIASSSGQAITVASGGTFTTGATGSTGWGLLGGSGSYELDALGFIGPAGLIIGPPGGATYSGANSSIAGNGPHNPFINQTATFLLDISGVTATTHITGATFSFGTTEGTDLVPGTPTPTPEPSTSMLLGLGLVGLLALRRKQIFA